MTISFFQLQKYRRDQYCSYNNNNYYCYYYTIISSLLSSLSSSLSEMQLSQQPIWEEHATTSAITPINQTHSIFTLIGNGTLAVPDIGQTVNMTNNNGTAIISPVTGSNNTVSAYGKENVFSSEDGDTSAITFHEIIHYNSATL